MVQSIGKGGGLAREALLAAMKAQAKSSDRVQQASNALDAIASGDASRAEQADPTGFVGQLKNQIEGLDAQVKGVDQLPEDLLTGKVQDIHEIAVRVKEAEFRFRFAMEIRNKLLDAYREVMRMNV